MNPETLSFLRDLSQRLGVGMEQLVDLFVPRVVAGAIVDLVFVGVASTLSIWLFPLWWKHECRYEGDEPIKRIACGVVGLVATAVIFVVLEAAVSALVAPRAAAIKDILSMLPGACS